MKDGLQGISFDRWLMRIKDILQIAITVGALLIGGYKYLKTIEQKDAKIQQVESENTRLRIQLAEK